MKIYIASSWKNQHGVEMLTDLLRELNHTVVSWIENSYDEHLYEGAENLKKWINSINGSKAFEFDTQGALNCDLLIFYTYAGNDAHAEMAIAWTKGIPVIGLWQKGCEEGLMSKMVSKWCYRYTEVLEAVQAYAAELGNEENKAQCMDCKDTYPFGVDIVFPNDQWRRINPKVSGLLCGNCIAKRANLVPGVIKISATLDTKSSEYNFNQRNNLQTSHY